MTGELTSPCLFAPPESRALAETAASAAGIALAPLEDRRFEGGEFKLRPLESVRGRSAFVLQTLAATGDAPTADRLVRLLFLISVLRDAGAARRIVLIPYLAYARKDRRTQLRDPVSSRYVAQLLEAAGADQVVAIDVHNPAAFDNAFRVPVDHLTALPMFVDHFARRLAPGPLLVASPDVGGIKRAQLFQELLAERVNHPVELAFLEKRRASGVVSGDRLVGMTTDNPTVIVIDDLCASGGTLIRAATTLRRAGASSVHVAVTHVPIDSGLAAVLACEDVSEMVVTDSVGPSAQRLAQSSAAGDRLVVLSAASLIGSAIARMSAGRPLAPLLSRWPLPGDV
jgi:ribose-phosphate pyrophosphokinase